MMPNAWLLPSVKSLADGIATASICSKTPASSYGWLAKNFGMIGRRKVL